MPRNRSDKKGGRKSKTTQQQGRHARSQGNDADTGESVSMQGRDDPNRVGGRGRRTTQSRPEEDDAEGGRAPSVGDDSEEGIGRSGADREAPA